MGAIYRRGGRFLQLRHGTGQRSDVRTRGVLKMGENETRRDFAKLAMGGAAMLSAASKVNAKMPAVPPGIKIGTSAGQPTPENLLYLKQLGVKWVSLGVRPE